MSSARPTPSALLLGEDPLSRGASTGYATTMMHSVCSRCLLTLVTAIGLVGCGSTESRSSETVAASGSLPSGSHPRPEQEKARIGDTQEMVLNAMGSPDEQRDVTDADGQQSIWIYKNYFQKPEHIEQSGWSKVLVRGVHDQYGTEIQKPVTQDISRTQVVADIQVAFKSGVVSSVAQVRH